MSDSSTRAERRGCGAGLPAWLAPRDVEEPGMGRTRLVETTLLLLAFLLLAVATADDVFLQTHVNHRLVADLRTWRAYTGHDYHNVSPEQDIFGHTSRDFVCGNTTPGPPKERTQICLVITGPIRHGRRAVHAGWYLPPKTEDLLRYRYACFGSAAEQGLCRR
jgi:hypothetical protein